MKKFFWLLVIIIFLSSVIKADFSLAKQNSVEIYFFYSAICPHCKKEKEFLKDLKNKYPEIEVKEYEVISNPENKEILNQFYEKYQVPTGKQGWVPVTFTPTEYFIGFNEKIAKDIESCIKECLLGERPVPQKI